MDGVCHTGRLVHMYSNIGFLSHLGLQNAGAALLPLFHGMHLCFAAGITLIKMCSQKQY